MQKTYFFGTQNHFYDKCSLIKCVQNSTRNFFGNFFSGIPDPDFDPDSTLSGFLEFFESIAYIKHLCQRIFELYPIVGLWTGMYYITSPLCPFLKDIFDNYNKYKTIVRFSCPCLTQIIYLKGNFYKTFLRVTYFLICAHLF